MTNSDARRAIWLVSLLALLMTINYADRGSLAIAAPLLRHELHIQPAQMGVLLSAFFWSYALAQPLAGRLVEHVGFRRVLPIGLAIWAVATAACGLATGFTSLLLLRIAMGLGESVIFPANAHVLAHHVPESRRGLANAVIMLGLYAGPALGTLAGGLMMAHYGWQAVFFAMGGLSLLWLPLWLATRLPPSVLPDDGLVQPIAWRTLLRERALWGMAFGQFCYSYPAYLLLTWLPLYLVDGLDMPIARMAWIAALAPVCQAAGAALSGGLSDHWIRRGRSITLVRKGFLLGGLTACATMLVILALVPASLAVPCLFLMAFSTGLMGSMSFTVGQTLAGPAAAGRWIGVQNMVGNLAGVTVPLVTGLIVQRTGSFHLVFIVSAAITATGLLFWGVVVRRLEPVKWAAA